MASKSKIKITAPMVIDLLRTKHSADVFVTECKNGPSYCAGLRKMDAWVMPRSWAHMTIKCYEVKVSRSDFLNDKKWQEYLPYCHELYFVAPKGVIEPNELPPEAGLLQVASTGTNLFTKKKAARRNIELPEELYQYILMCRTDVRAETVPHADVDYWKAWLARKEENQCVGSSVSKRLQKMFDEQVSAANNKSRQVGKDVKRLQWVADLLEEMDIPVSSFDGWRFENDVKEKLEQVRTGFSNDFVKHLELLQRDVTKLMDEINPSPEEEDADA